MNFLYPQFLFGLFSIGIPILIHLFNLQKPKKIYFSNISFLKNVQNLSKKSIKVKNILILLTRILFLCFLVLAFAQPYFPNASKVAQIDYYNIYVDNSQSMQSNIGKERALDVAVKDVESLSEQLTANSLINIFTNEFSNTSGQGIGKEKVKEVLSEIDFAAKSRSLSEIINRKALNRGDALGKKKAIYIFSDFQKKTISNLNAIKFDSAVKYFLVPISPEQTSNIYIDSVWIENPYININENNTLKAKVVNSGNEARENVVLKLNIDNRQAATSTVNLAPNGNSIISFNFTVTDAGLKNGVISLSDYPVIFDNEYFFSFKTVDKINILEITKGSTASIYVAKVYKDSTLFNYTTKSVENLDYGLLATSDLVILNNLDQIDEGFKDALLKFSKDQGTILLVPSANLDPVTSNKWLNTFGIFIDKSSEIDTTKTVAELQQPDYANPFFHGVFESTKDRMLMPTEKSLITWNNVGKSLLVFKNGKPFLSQVDPEAGRLFLFANNLKYPKGLAQHALFVPVMYKIALLSNSLEGQLAYNLDKHIIKLPVEATGSNSIYKLFKDSLEVIPNQRITGKNLIMDVPEIDIEPGHYQLRLKEKLIENIAFNYPENESVMEFYSVKELKELFSKHKNVTVFDNMEQSDFSNDIKKENAGYPFWKICLVIALLFLFLEILLLRFYRLYESSPKVN